MAPASKGDHAPQPSIDVYASNDTSTAALNLASLRAFYSAFPEYKQRELTIAGESYAGIYVPMLAKEILQANKAAADATPAAAAAAGATGGGGGGASGAYADGHINLQAIMVGSGAIATGDWYVTKKTPTHIHPPVFSFLTRPLMANPPSPPSLPPLPSPPPSFPTIFYADVRALYSMYTVTPSLITHKVRGVVDWIASRQCVCTRPVLAKAQDGVSVDVQELYKGPRDHRMPSTAGKNGKRNG